MSDTNEVSALYDRARALLEQGNRGDAIAACAELVERYGASDHPAHRVPVARALLLQAQAFSSPWVARREEALALFDEVLRRIDEAAEVDENGTIAADALLGRAGCLRIRDRFEDAIETCDALGRRIAWSTAAALRRRSADGQFQKVAALVKLNRRDEAIAVCDAAVTRYGDDAEAELRDATARMLFEKGSLLLGAKRPDEALATFEQLLDRLQNEEQPPFLEWIVRGLNGKGAALERLGRLEEAVEAWDDMLAREGSNDLLTADTMLSKGRALVALGRRDEAVATFDGLIRRCREQSRYLMGDDYVKWALHQVGADAVAQRKALEPSSAP